MKFALFAIGMLLAVTNLLFGHESPIDHVERQMEFFVEKDRLILSYRVEFTERATMMQFYKMDLDRNGEISKEESDAYFQIEAAELAKLLTISVEGKTLILESKDRVKLDPGLGQTFTFSASLAALSPGKHEARFFDGFSRMYPGAYRCRGGNGVKIDTNPVVESGQEHAAWIELKLEITA